jgi:hypothetical protein
MPWKFNPFTRKFDYYSVEATTFTGLTDTPSSYSGQAGKTVKVNTPETALEFAPFPVSQWAVRAEVTTTANVDYVDFTGLDINTDFAYVLFTTIKNPAAATSQYYIFVEGDYTTTNYYNQFIHGDGTTSGVSRENFPSIGAIESGERGSSVVYIFRDPDGYFRYSSIISRGTGTTIKATLRSGSKTATLTNITSLRISAAQTGGIGAGSKFLLCQPRS